MNVIQENVQSLVSVHLLNAVNVDQVGLESRCHVTSLVESFAHNEPLSSGKNVFRNVDHSCNYDSIHGHLTL